AGGLRVLGDRARIQQVVTNLLINAIKYSGNSKEVDIELRQRGDRAQFSVTDYGIGILEEQQGRVFELYFRGSNAPGGNYGGLGLGLYIGKAIVEQHGGEIGMVSEEGKGSTFHFSLPLADTNPSDRELQG
ncbi:MAG: ATP-binding protein, partial [Chloroflexota bacterium]|nr:ATP-binding protein [Chloroflexota bacterium]